MGLIWVCSNGGLTPLWGTFILILMPFPFPFFTPSGGCLAPNTFLGFLFCCLSSFFFPLCYFNFFSNPHPTSVHHAHDLINPFLNGKNGNCAISQHDIPYISILGLYLHVMTWLVIKGIIWPFRSLFWTSKRSP